MTGVLLLPLLASVTALGAGDPSRGEQRDRTGIEWALPFRAALAKATAEHRLLLIKPIAFGTDKAGGW